MKRPTTYQSACQKEIKKILNGHNPNHQEDLTAVGKNIRVYMWIRGRKETAQMLAAVDRAIELGLEAFVLSLTYRYRYGRNTLVVNNSAVLSPEEYNMMNAIAIWIPAEKVSG